MPRYIISLNEQDYACNSKELTTSSAGNRVFFVEANNIETAYLRALELFWEKTHRFARLNFCMELDYFREKRRFECSEMLKQEAKADGRSNLLNGSSDGDL